jgi:hypothetical protein
MLALKKHKILKTIIKNFKSEKIKILIINIKANKKIGYLECNKKHKN